MSPEELIDQIERARDTRAARSLLRPHTRTPGLSKAFFDRVVARMGSDPAAAKRLADRWRPFAELGDEPALAYRAKGGGERLAGQWLKSVESFALAGRHATRAVDRLAYQVGAVESLGRLGRTEEASRLGKRLVRGLLALGERGLAGRVRLNVAAALLWVDDYRAAKRWLLRAHSELRTAVLNHEAALCELSLSTCALLGGDPRQACALAEQARAAFAEMGQDHLVQQSESNLAQANLQMGRGDHALGTLLRLRACYGEGTLDSVRVEEFLGDAYLSLNMPEEAMHAFQTALDSPAIRSSPLNWANSHLGLAWAALALELAGPARRSARKAARAYEEFGNEVWRNVALLAEAKSEIGQNRPARALQAATLAASELRRLGAKFAEAEAHLLAARCKLALKESPRADLQLASRLIARRGLGGLEWLLHETRARAEPSRALSHYRRMHTAILRARAELVSTVARTAFLRDKSRALGDYLELLLSRPTPSRVREALDVIRATRAVALIDETLRAGWGAHSSELRQRLSQLRDELASSGSDSGPPGSPIRRSDRSAGSNIAVARRWMEWTHDLRAQIAETGSSESEAEAFVYTMTERSAHLIHAGRAVRLAPRAEIVDLRRWAHFELFAPMADRNASDCSARAALAQLARRVLPISTAGPGFARIAPEAELWSLPWPALVQDAEPVLALGPSFGRGSERAGLPERPRVVIWGAARPDLPSIEEEIGAVKGAFPDATHLATAGEIRSSLEKGHVDLLHVACHARLDPNVPMLSYLEFPDGRVYAFEIAQSAMSCGIVTLSACDTGALSQLNRNEPMGLVRSFLACRAKAVLASLWMLDDEAAMHFALMYNSELSRGRNVGDAVALARSKVRELLPHPYFWAPMVLFGGYEL